MGFVMGDFTYTVMGWAAGVALSLIVSGPLIPTPYVGLGPALKIDKGVTEVTAGRRGNLSRPRREYLVDEPSSPFSGLTL